MGKVIELQPKKVISKLENCSGCSNALNDVEGYHVIKLNHDKHIEHIGLCEDCYKVSVEYGVMFN